MNINKPHQAFYTVVFLNLAVFLIFGSTAAQMFSFWSESYAYSHGILLFPLVVGLYFYLLFDNPKLVNVRISIWNILGFLGLTLIWFIAHALSIQIIEFLSFFLIIILLNFTLTSQNIKNINHLWPLLLIIFTLPIWDFMPEILRTIETPVVVLALNLSFIEAVQDSFLIHVPAGSFLVETSCSGFNQFLVSIPLAVLYLYSRNLTLFNGYKIIISLLGLAIIFNIIRIYIIVVAGQMTHMKSSLVVDDHEYLAWLIYGIGVFIYFYYLDKKYVRLPDADKKASTSNLSLDNAKKPNKPIYILLLIMSLGPILILLFSVLNQHSVLNKNNLEAALFWKRHSNTVKFEPDFYKGDIVFNTGLSNMFGKTVDLYINYFTSQEQGREAINGMSKLVSNKLGSVVKQNYHSVELAQDKLLSLNESVVILKTGEKFLIWQWYYANTQHTNKVWAARQNNLFGILANKPQMASIVVSKKITSNENEARNVLSLFLNDNFAVLAAYLDSI